jgi:hypothetical protein
VDKEVREVQWSMTESVVGLCPGPCLPPRVVLPEAAVGNSSTGIVCDLLPSHVAPASSSELVI